MTINQLFFGYVLSRPASLTLKQGYIECVELAQRQYSIFLAAIDAIGLYEWENELVVL